MHLDHLDNVCHTKSYPDSSSSLPASTPNTIHHSCLTVCLPDSLHLDPHVTCDAALYYRLHAILLHMMYCVT